MNTGLPREELPTLLVVDDDRTFCRVMKRAMEARGFAVSVAHDVNQAIWMAEEDPPEFAVVDLKMPGPSGLTLIQKLKELDEQTRIVVLTGYGSIATAIEAIKMGATHYLAKPAKAEEIVAAFNRVEADPNVPITTEPMTVNRLEWEHIQRVLGETGNNITTAAKVLGMHRRTLQRKLNTKRPAKG